MSNDRQRCLHACTLSFRWLLSAAMVVSLVSSLALATATSALAEWTGGIEGGTVVRDSGNATALRLALRNNERPLSHYVFAEWLRGSAGENSYSVGYNPRYWISDKNYLFGETELGTDELFGIDREIRAIVGVGSQFINTPDQSLYAEVGVGGRSIDFDDAEDVSSEALGVARLGFQRKIIDLVRLDLLTSGTRSSEDVTEGSVEAGVSLRIAAGAVRLAYRNRYLKVGDRDSITEDDTFVTFSYGF